MSSSSKFRIEGIRAALHGQRPARDGTEGGARTPLRSSVAGFFSRRVAHISEGGENRDRYGSQRHAIGTVTATAQPPEHRTESGKRIRSRMTIAVVVGRISRIC